MGSTFWHIRQGVSSATGGETTGWTVNLSGTAPVKCKTLAEAKVVAIQHGASGKWKREVKPNGVRGMAVVHYIDATTDTAPAGNEEAT